MQISNNKQNMNLESAQEIGRFFIFYSKNKLQLKQLKLLIIELPKAFRS